MKLRVLSDLHNEFSEFVPPAVDCDVVVLAGDIDVGIKGLDWASRTFPKPPVVYTSGNHEYYGQGPDWRGTSRRLRAKASELGIHFLDAGEVILDHVRFVGCNLWTDFDLFGEDRRHEALAAAAMYMTDYRAIKVDGRPLLPEETRTLHLAQRAWLERKLDEPANGRWRATVVCSHTLPSMRSVAEIYKKDLTSAAFASNLDHLVAQANAWIHGHTHVSCSYALGGCSVVCNPRGYTSFNRSAPENPTFDPTLVIEL